MLTTAIPDKYVASIPYVACSTIGYYSNKKCDAYKHESVKDCARH